MDFPVHFHINVQQSADRDAYELARKDPSMKEAGKRFVNRSLFEGPRLLTDLMFGLVLERHPRMRVVFAEYELLWILPFMMRLEGNVSRFGLEHPDIPHMTATPSETIRRQVYVTFQNDPAGVAAAEKLDLLDNLMWSNDSRMAVRPGSNRAVVQAQAGQRPTRWRGGSISAMPLLL
jgi:hypothetical protein